MRALLYLERRYLRHQIEAIVRAPLRLTIWIPYAFSIAYLVFARATRPHDAVALGFGLRAYVATGIGGLYLGSLGVTIALAASGRIAGFRFAAEAVLLSNAGIRPIAIAIWLQVRRLAMSSGRYLGTLLYVFLIFSPRHVGIGAAARSMIATVLAIAVVMSAELPIFLLARGRARAFVLTLGVACAAIGFSFAALGFFGRGRFEHVVRHLGIDPGHIALAVIAGDPRAIAAFFVLLGLSALAIEILGRDALPELYAISQTSLAGSRRRRDVRPGPRFAHAPSRHRARVPSGALAVVWKDWVGFKRGRGVVWLWIAGCAFWTSCGVVIGLLDLREHDATLVLTLVACTAILLLFGTPSSAATIIAADLGKPLFWLSHAPLRTRIAAWTFARTWRGAIAIALGPLAAGIVLGDARITLVALPFVFATFWALQSLGVGLYAVFPNPLDTRGPMVFVRILVTAAYALPAAIIAFGIGAWSGDYAIALLAASVVFGIEGWIALELAALRFAEHGATLATLARST